jgi:hypothetical protein
MVKKIVRPPPKHKLHVVGMRWATHVLGAAEVLAGRMEKICLRAALRWLRFESIRPHGA